MSQTKIFLYGINFTKLFKRYNQINVWIFNWDSNPSEKTNSSFPGTIKHSYFGFFSQRWSGRNSTNPLVQWIGLRVRATFNIMLVTFRGLLHICAGKISTKIKREFTALWSCNGYLCVLKSSRTFSDNFTSCGKIFGNFRRWPAYFRKFGRHESSALNNPRKRF